VTVTADIDANGMCTFTATAGLETASCTPTSSHMSRAAIEAHMKNAEAHHDIDSRRRALHRAVAIPLYCAVQRHRPANAVFFALQAAGVGNSVLRPWMQWAGLDDTALLDPWAASVSSAWLDEMLPPLPLLQRSPATDSLLQRLTESQSWDLAQLEAAGLIDK